MLLIKLQSSSNNDKDIVVAGGWNIQFKLQPPNSSDLNVLFLFGIFNSVQWLHHEASSNTIDELIECVQDAFDKLKRNTVDNITNTL